ncbi:hypothetical protein [Streptomyces fimbriatus]|uniref:Uncharacterized protein n=1 Tax=Streptomyces fimbriatus TaxID=68197 RepID=A0ABW0DID4_STRFI
MRWFTNQVEQQIRTSRAWMLRPEPVEVIHRLRQEYADREVVEQTGEDCAVGVDEHGPADLALQDQQLVPQRADLKVLVPPAPRQQAQEGEGAGHGEAGRAQQHDRS